MTNCPNCGSKNYFYVQTVKEYHTFIKTPYGVELISLDEAVPESDSDSLYCEDCEHTESP